MRERFVCGNWKMNPPTVDDAVALARRVAAMPERGAGARDGRLTVAVRVAVAPPAIALAAVADALRGSRVSVFAQDVHWQQKGAFTGQVAASMLRGRAAGAIVGHSEVRRDQGDDDARVAAKVARALDAGLRVILCVGESEAQFVAGETQTVVAAQIAADLARARRAVPVPAAMFGPPLVVAYEPIWAIGTGRPATGAHAAAAARTIRAALREAGWDADGTPVLYGGSVSADGVGEFVAAEGIDGALVGGASLEADEFAAIVEAFARAI